MRTRIHVNQHAIKANKGQLGLPVLTIKDYKRNRKADTAEVLDSQGNVVCRVVYRPDDPLDCGAKCWVETDLEVRAT